MIVGGSVAGAWHKFMVFLGLGEDEEAEEYLEEVPLPMYEEESFDSAAGPPSQESPPRIKTIRTLEEGEEPPEGAVMRRHSEPPPQPAERLRLVAPSSFDDAKEIGDHLKRNVPVIINLADVDRDLRRRLVDFSSGLAYAMSGTMERVAENVFLIAPSDVEVSAEERRRMRERGLFSSGV